MLILIVNVALNKPAYLKYQYRPGDHRHDASNAVDGKKIRPEICWRSMCFISYWQTNFHLVGEPYQNTQYSSHHDLLHDEQ